MLYKKPTNILLIFFFKMVNGHPDSY